MIIPMKLVLLAAFIFALGIIAAARAQPIPIEAIYYLQLEQSAEEAQFDAMVDPEGQVLEDWVEAGYYAGAAVALSIEQPDNLDPANGVPAIAWGIDIPYPLTTPNKQAYYGLADCLAIYGLMIGQSEDEVCYEVGFYRALAQSIDYVDPSYARHL